MTPAGRAGPALTPRMRRAGAITLAQGAWLAVVDDAGYRAGRRNAGGMKRAALPRPQPALRTVWPDTRPRAPC